MKKPPKRPPRAKPAKSVVDLLSRAFFVLQGMEITWHHEHGSGDFDYVMGNYAAQAAELCKLIEPALHQHGIATTFRLTPAPRGKP